MYKRHKCFMICCFLISLLGSYYLKIDFTPIAGSGLDIIAICTAVYLAVYPAIQGNQTLRTNLQQQDSEIRNKSEMGVLNSYIIVGLIVGLISIVAFCLLLVVNDNAKTISFLIKHKREVPCWRYWLSSICYALFSADLIQIFWVGKFIVNRVSNNA